LSQAAVILPTAVGEVSVNWKYTMWPIIGSLASAAGVAPLIQHAIAEPAASKIAKVYVRRMIGFLQS
jgi:hypothetical protein